MKTTKLALTALCAVAAVLTMLVPNAGAVSLTFGDSRDLGYIQFGIPSGDAARTSYVNFLLDMAAPSGPIADGGTGQTYTRSANDPLAGSYPNAVFALNGDASGSYNIGSSGYLYLFAKYDGPNYGSKVWYIGGLTGTIDIPVFPPDTPEQFGLSGVTFFNGSTSVPDGGTTVMLLGTALAGMGAVRRFLRN